MTRAIRQLLITVAVLAAVAFGWALAQPPATETGFIQVEPDVRLFYQRFGTGQPTVFIPNRQELAIQFAPLLYFYDVVMWDPRGRGLSDRPEDLARYGIDVEIADAEKVRQHFGSTDITYIGISLWSAVALHYAAQHPDSVARVVALGPIAPAAELMTEPFLAVARDVSDIEEAMQTLEAADLAESREYCLLSQRHGWYSNLVHLERVAMGEAFNICQYANEYGHRIMPVIFGGIIGKWGEWDWRDDFATIKQPVLLVWGDHEWGIPGIHIMVDLIENARGLELSNSDHAVWLDANERTVAILHQFLRGQWPAGAR